LESSDISFEDHSIGNDEEVKDKSHSFAEGDI